MCLSHSSLSSTSVFWGHLKLTVGLISSGVCVCGGGVHAVCLSVCCVFICVGVCDQRWGCTVKEGSKEITGQG